ncbi:MAG: hypothetical protein R3C97_18435, partial [Geminicoccaceae bacterium]
MKIRPTRRACASLFPLLLLLSACGNPSGDVGLVEYRSPSVSPALPAREVVRGSESASIRGAVADIERMGFQIETIDEGNGILTAIYLGDAERYVDCGQMRLGDEGTFQPASAARLSFRAFPDQPSWLALRQMRLDARLVARTRSDGIDTRLNAMAAYVLTRTVDTLNNEGAVLGTVRETVSFETGGVGRFDNGTTCHPTGELERAVAGAMIAAAARVPGDPYARTSMPGYTDDPAIPGSAMPGMNDGTLAGAGTLAGETANAAPRNLPSDVTNTAPADGIVESELPDPGLGPVDPRGPTTEEILARDAARTRQGNAAAAIVDGEAASVAGDVAATTAGTAAEVAGNAVDAAGQVVSGAAQAAASAGAVAAGAAASTLRPADTADVDVSPAAGEQTMASLGTPQDFLASSPCADAALTPETGGGLRLVGYVAGSAERERLLSGIAERAGGAALKDDTRLLPPGTCEALRFLDDVQDNPLDGFSISFTDATGALEEGSEIELVVSLPGPKRFFYVGYIE